jgi:sugar phosphate isomerase/epimerase
MDNAKRYMLGAATHVADLHINRDWFLSGNRDLEIGDAADPNLLDDRDEQQRRADEVNTLLDGHTGRRGVHGPFRGVPLNSPDRLFQQLVAKRYIQAVEFTAMLRGTHMVIHSPFNGWVNPFTFNGDPGELEKNIELIEATLADVLPVAEHHGVILVLENIHDFNCFPVLATMQAINHSNLRMSLDIGHCQLRVPQGGMPNDQYIREAGPWLEHIHIQDNDALSDRHWAPGDGLINFHSIFEALRLGDQNPRMIIELKDKAAVRRGAAYLKERGYAK